MILMVVGLMGIGGIVIAGFTQGAKQDTEHERFLHNQRVLKEAKQALLQYAYNYPVTAGNGPGRLPCPDTDPPGNPPTVAHPAGFGIPNATAFCGSPNGIVGRFPWAEEEMNFYEAKDASGEHLWYAVSSNFSNNPGTQGINSATVGTITLEDRSGAVIHDGTASSGVAAVIIAPGAPIDRNGVMQVRTTNANKVDPVNYLDRFGAADNANFINGNADGFVTGPIKDVVTGDLYVNDQMIVVTNAEVIAMAEKATLQAYRSAIDDYLAKTTGEYPWLFNYENLGAPADLMTLYPVDDNFIGAPTYHDNYGRIPTIFSPYFAGEASQLMQTSLEGILSIDFGSLAAVRRTGGDATDFRFNPATVSLNFPIAGVFEDMQFEEQGGSPNGLLKGTLPTTPAPPQVFPFVIFFWDDDDPDAPVQPTGFWSLCPAGADEEEDCWRDAALNPDPHGSNDSREEIMRLELQISFNAGTVNFDHSALPLSVNYIPANANSHARIQATFAGSALNIDSGGVSVISASYQATRHNHEGEVFAPSEFGNVTVADLLGGATTITLELNYYPEIPKWAWSNGWHDSIRMAYADSHRPGVPGDCDPVPTGLDDCLKLPDFPGAPRDHIALLVLAGEHDWNDEGADGFQNDLSDVFDADNDNNDLTFFRHSGNDEILTIK